MKRLDQDRRQALWGNILTPEELQQLGPPAVRPTATVAEPAGKRRTPLWVHCILIPLCFLLIALWPVMILFVRNEARSVLGLPPGGK